MSKLGKSAEAKALFDGLVESGKSGVVTEFVNFYGAEGTTASTTEIKNAAAYFTQALGELGLGHKKQAKKLFAKVLELKPDHLYAHELSSVE